MKSAFSTDIRRNCSWLLWFYALTFICNNSISHIAEWYHRQRVFSARRWKKAVREKEQEIKIWTKPNNNNENSDTHNNVEAEHFTEKCRVAEWLWFRPNIHPHARFIDTVGVQSREMICIRQWNGEQINKVCQVDMVYIGEIWWWFRKSGGDGVCIVLLSPQWG